LASLLHRNGVRSSWACWVPVIRYRLLLVRSLAERSHRRLPGVGGMYFIYHLSHVWPLMNSSFWINLPIGGLAFAAVVLGYRTPQESRSSVPTSEKLRHLNPLTYLLWCAALVCYLLALQYGGQTMAWSSATVVGLLVGFVLLLCTGVVWDQWCGDNALLQKRLVRVRAIAAAAPFVFL